MKVNRLKIIKKDTEGMSPASVYQCVLDGENVYYKSIDKIYACTTYSVKREAKVMKWLNGKVSVPTLIETGEKDDAEYLIMSEIKGNHIDYFANEPKLYVSYLAKAIKKLWSVNIDQCPFDSRINYRLEELKYLLDNGLADTDREHWQEDTKFSNPTDLYMWLANNKPNEECVLSHGDISANMFIKDNEAVFYDLARTGVADKWLDIAMVVRDIREVCPQYEKMFFKLLGLEPDYKKIEYYVLLDEMF